MPAPLTWTVTGHGWGHGHGLSQWGALGAAPHGLGLPQILALHYPGTPLSRTRGPLKVHLTADKKDLLVHAHGLRLLAPGGGRKSSCLAKVWPRATRWRILPRGQKSIVRKGVQGQGWLDAGWTAFAGRGRVQRGQPADDAAAAAPRLSAEYRGALRSVERDTVNVLSLDRYVQGVVPSEVPVSWPADTVRAQAVAARTYAAYERASATTYYDICDTTACQVYGGEDAEEPSSNAAVRATRGRVVIHQGGPAFTQFSSSNGGWSSAGSQPYLVAQPDPYEASSGNPNATWTAT